MNAPNVDRAIESRMRSAGIAAPTITAFLNAVHKVMAGETGLLPGAALEPGPSLPELTKIADPAGGADGLLQQLAVIKLNGGLGTGMGLDRAKSLLIVKGQDSFLDFIAKQISHLRGPRREPLFYLMDSFSTQKDTLDYLKKYPGLGDETGQLDFLQNMVPKIDPQTYEPVSWPAQPDLEWCPPGHGDIYPSLLGGGLLERMSRQGIRFFFVST